MKATLLAAVAIASLATGGWAVGDAAPHAQAARAGIVTTNNFGPAYNQGNTQQSRVAAAASAEVRRYQLANNLYPAYNRDNA